MHSQTNFNADLMEKTSRIRVDPRKKRITAIKSLFNAASIDLI
jgi:hypothetical protein